MGDPLLEFTERIRKLTLQKRKGTQFSLPVELVAEFDKWVTRNGYDSRSAAMTDMIAKVLVEEFADQVGDAMDNMVEQIRDGG